MNRRQFVQTAGCASIAFGLSPKLIAGALETPFLPTMGLQLWTVRNQLENDLEGTMKSIAQAGYHQVEMMNTLQSKDVHSIAMDHGLSVTSAFFDWNVICRPNAQDVPSIESVVEKASDLQLDYLVFGYIGKGHRETVEQYQAHAETANRAGELCKEANIQLCYHNHSFEFQRLDHSTATGFDVFIDHFDDELVKFELDVFWAAIGGLDPVETIEKLGARTAQLHLKDWIADGEILFDEGTVPVEAFKEVGQGVLDFPKILAAAVKHNVVQCHVEQDQSPDPIKSIGLSYQFLSNL